MEMWCEVSIKHIVDFKDLIRRKIYLIHILYRFHVKITVCFGYTGLGKIYYGKLS